MHGADRNAEEALVIFVSFCSNGLGWEATWTGLVFLTTFRAKRQARQHTKYTNVGGALPGTKDGALGGMAVRRATGNFVPIARFNTLPASRALRDDPSTTDGATRIPELVC